MNLKIDGQRTVRGIAGIVILTGVIVTAGWIFDIPVLKSILPHWVTMKLTTALSFFLSGIILYTLSKYQREESELGDGLLLSSAAIVFVLMAIFLSSSVLDVKSGVEDLFVKEARDAVKTVVPGRPSIGTMINFLLIAAAAVSGLFKLHNLKTRLSIIGMSVTVLGSTAILGYIINAPLLYYSIKGYSAAMAFHTALLFIFLGLGLTLVGKQKEEGKEGHYQLRIKAKILVSNLLTIFIIVILGLAFGYSLEATRKENTKNAVTNRIMKNIFELNILTNDYILYKKERTKKQWLSKHQTIDLILAEDFIFESDEKNILKEIRIAHHNCRDIFVRLSGSSLSKELEKILDVHLSIKSQAMISNAFHLAELLRDKVTAVHDFNKFVVLSAIIILFIGALGGYLILNKAISVPILQLTKDVEKIDPRNLEFHIDPQIIEKNDEIGSLARAFSNMTAKLKETTVLRDDLIIEVEQRIEAEERVNLIVKTSSNGILMIDKDGKICLINDQIEKLFGYRKEEILGEKIEVLVPQRFRYAHPGHRDGFFIKPEARRMGMGRDLFAITKDHKEFPVEIGLSPLKIKGALFVQATITDITERKKTEEKIKRINKDLETLLHVVSHDLMEPLRAIVNFSERVRDNYARNLDTKGKDYLRRIVNGARRMRRLLDDILTLSRVRQLVKPVVEVIDSKDIVKNALEGLELKIKETKANIKISKELPKIQADVTWATQAVYNLIANALKFTKEGCAPDIEIKPCRFMDDFSCEVGIVVRDRGIGISAEYAERIFELFQRAVGREIEGTGAGLAIVHEVAIRHNGRAFARPREGGGTEFFITFGEKSS